MEWIRRVARGYESFREGYYEENRALFEELATKGQSPRVMVISCCDSRVEPSVILGAEPGDLFVVRNVANLVPPYEPDSHYHGTSAALEFAVKNLKVRHIVILGHAQCGGVKAALTGTVDPETSFIGKWMSLTDAIRDDVVKNHADEPFEDQLLELEHQSISQSVAHLKQFPFIADAVEAEDLYLHGWHFDIHSGELLALNHSDGDFEPLPF
ncbi:MAG: carbonic anhydrase [Alphaproteobacteria bacterium]